MPVKKSGAFWLTSHNRRFRQYRMEPIDTNDRVLTDREETINLLCTEIEQLKAEVEKVKPVLDAAKELKNGTDEITSERLSDDTMEMFQKAHQLSALQKNVVDAVRAMEE